MTKTSDKQHEIGKPKGSSAKCLLKILITGKLKPFVLGRENMWFRMQKKENAGSIFVTPTTASKFRE